MKLKYLPVCICLVGLMHSNSDAQIKTRSYIVDSHLAPREHVLDILHMKLEVSFEPTKGLVKGKVTHLFTPLRQKVDSFFLDGPGIRVKEAMLNGKPVKYKTDSSGISFFPEPALTWEQKDSLTIVYEANPRKGLYFIGWNDPDNFSRKQIWSQGQGIDNRNWIPFYDEMNDKLITEVIVKFDKDYKVLSNGTKLKEKDNNDGTKTWHYTMTHPHAPYLLMLGVGKYDIYETVSKSGVPMLLWYYPEWKNRVESTYIYSERMVDFFEKEIGVPYGWESYSQIPVQDFMYGAMENTTATLFGDFFFVDERSYLERNYVAVNAHELAHQWFGDLVTARSSAHHWLQESFATYYNQMFEREVFGQDHFDFARRAANNSAIEASLKDKLPIVHSEAGSVRMYPKGAFVLNMMKYLVGREAYNKVIKHYLETHKYQNVDTEDLLITFHETLGYSLDWFWEEWLYKGGEPSYEVSYKNVKNTSGEAFTGFSVTQTQEFSDVVGLFKMPVWFEVHYTDGTVDRKQEWIENQHHTVLVPNEKNKSIDFVLFDPNNEIMKSVVFKKPFEQLQAQALKAAHMLDRLDAVIAMRDISINVKQDVLLRVFAKETFHAVKSEVVTQLSKETDKNSLILLKAAINDKDVMVRKAVVKNLTTIPVELLPEYEKLLKDPSYEVIAAAMESLYINNPSGIAKYLEMTKGVEGTKGKCTLIKWLELASASTGDAKYTDQLVNYSSISYEFLTRMGAMSSLKKLNYFDDKFMGNLIDGLFNPNAKLSTAAGETLQYFYAQDKYKKMIRDYTQSRKGEKWQKDLIEKYMD